MFLNLENIMSIQDFIYKETTVKLTVVCLLLVCEAWTTCV